MERQTVKVYVRLPGEHDEDRGVRRLSFRIPAGISQASLLDYGFAIDGNEAVRDVEGDGNGTLADNLLIVQRGLVEEEGPLEAYDVQFV